MTNKDDSSIYKDVMQLSNFAIYIFAICPGAVALWPANMVFIAVPLDPRP